MNPDVASIRIVLPYHLRALAKTGSEITVPVQGIPTQHSVLSSLESLHPTLCGTIRDHVTLKRRPFLRFFACGEDLSFDSPDTPLPDAVQTGAEPFFIVGAIAGG